VQEIPTYIPEKKTPQEGKILFEPQPYNPAPVQEKNNTTAADSEEDSSWKQTLIIGALSVAGVSGAIWLGYRLIKKYKSNKEEYKSFEDGAWATIAKQIKMAFDNDGVWGTNTEALRQAIASVQSLEDWDKVIASYRTQYNGNLIHDLADELQSTEYNEMIQIIAAKPKKRGEAPNLSLQYRAWAKRLKAAFDKSYWFLPGSDSQAITVTLTEIPTQNAFVQVGVAYKGLYGKNLIEELKSEGEFGQTDEWMEIIYRKRKI
jgi:hypothetical protein